MKIGDSVKVKYPFDYLYKDIYVIEDIKEDGTCVIDGDRDFDPIYLEKVYGLD